ncbi:MAG: hypothetical protein A3H50_01435 [Candidatus Levybacteria bacterium RIFCSPLOWO2_02_FULL_37_10]|nr:MAG: hypothetical protein A2860_03150 [Candidatus Levybacteria bacterium RIFCSPHIGHO2_01_FULL_37_33]OGH16919.1 MAG: hypothetical protein A3C97_00175 [Candidatus Levybacteria bacterium RIFCSPHIGHO2_02_FULL_37_11]OGH29865.1 MAG: hypothetical protein A3F30_01590 [Candidatus Levybacteria bacterium RIFCSPHIGHO2_12_FULL_37_12]OGH32971.1 MAG: hypothetical protein A2953_00950 [Candidatus Levybacteria bacterium RIFCSPLOWO2_01_FULL_36_54]OGH43334.1 MAG: hypothetical protein A3H50_01435 [Candidatus Lev
MIPVNKNTKDTESTLYMDEVAIKEFQEMYLQKHGQKLTSEEALELGTRLINFVKAVYGNNLPKLKTLDIGTKKSDT